MRRLLLAVAGLVVLTACRAELVVDVVVEPDGSGTVTVEVVVDAETVAEVPELAGGLRVDDLAAAGWVFERPSADDGAVLRATKAFASPEDLSAVLAEIDGPDGVIVASQLTVTQGRDQREYQVSITVDPSRELADLSDDEVTSLLDGQPLGRPVADLDDVDLSMELRVTLPGDVVASDRFLAGDPVGRVEATSVVVDDEAIALREDADDQRDLARTIVLGLAAAWVVVALWWLLGRRRRQRREVGTEPETVPFDAGPPVATTVVPEPPPGPRPTPDLDDIEVATGEWRPE